jgi:glycosyltransferase involved in cell wall biosynthesis
MDLSVIVLFCDKDFQYIPNLLKQLDKKLACNYELILVDNREKNKTEISAINEFYENHNGFCITPGRNLGQVVAKKTAFEQSSGKYVWFFDGDDEPCDVITQTLLENLKEDLIVFNFGYYREDDDEQIYIECSDEDKRKFTGFKDAEYLTNIGVTCWNKFIYRKILEKIFSYVKTDKVVSVNEDVWLMSAALNKSRVVREIPLYIYNNRPDRGISANKKITSITNFKKIIQGYDETMKLFRIEFPEDCLLYNEKAKRLIDAKYLLKRVITSVKEIRNEECKMICDVFTKREITSSLIEIEKNQKEEVIELKEIINKII